MLGLWEGSCRPGPSTAHVSFGDPDVILVVETIANWVGVASITKEMKEKYALVKVK